MRVLAGKSALVTGASRGIGRAIALRLAQDGAQVAVHYGSHETDAQETVASIDAAGGSAFAIRANLREPDDIRALWTAYDAEASGVDIIVNNAGTALLQPFEQQTAADFDQVFAVNARAPFLLIQAGALRLRDGGRIINISSAVTRVAFPDDVAYAMTKGALATMTLTLAKVFGPRAITVNAVSPAVVRTDMTAWLANPELEQAAARLSTFGRVAEPGDIADVVAFLASDDARWITGQCLDSSGGTQL
ncbi:SDR family oxidoreductase [Kribbella sindirgiensis]|uniref:SDR family oxidoreductase n=1 Tax=Kribbella sindirgiensis TaxID=1124744 RepID=A0A4R0J1B1_9ACTN|nr:SDR family oxidoreductase [Kribbella sindirgiensis]TCC34925.1 SDR family oxidoreductase [Kribbella sindirgiensis]